MQGWNVSRSASVVFLSLIWARDFELLCSAGIPIRGGHTSDGMEFSSLKVEVFIEDLVPSVNEVDDADNQSIGANFQSGVLGAFERGGSFRDAGDGDFFGRDSGE